MTRLKKVLLIDDDAITNKVNSRLLTKLKITDNIDVVLNGKEALDYLLGKDKKDLPDLIFLDINMPVMNGFEFLEAFHKEFRIEDRPVVLMMLTSSLANSDYTKAKSYNEVTQYIPKPLSPTKLQEILDEHFKQ